MDLVRAWETLVPAAMYVADFMYGPPDKSAIPREFLEKRADSVETLVERLLLVDGALFALYGLSVGFYQTDNNESDSSVFLPATDQLHMLMDCSQACGEIIHKYFLGSV